MAASRSNRMWTIAVIVLVLAAAGAGAAIALTKKGGTSATASKPRTTCVSTGCALVSSSQQLAQPTGFYGASCSGLTGSWFLKIMEEGTATQLKPGYDLRWTFEQGVASAKPSGTIVVPSSSGAGVSTGVSMTLANGKLTLRGTTTGGSAVDAVGSLVVRLSRAAAGPQLVFTETGLSEAEQELGLNSPFDSAAQPLVIPVKTVKVMQGCAG